MAVLRLFAARTGYLEKKLCPNTPRYAAVKLQNRVKLEGTIARCFSLTLGIGSIK